MRDTVGVLDQHLARNRILAGNYAIDAIPKRNHFTPLQGGVDVG
jgi:hypothetical protein